MTRGGHTECRLVFVNYESLVMSTISNYGLYLSHTKRSWNLEAAHHKFQRRILGISWRDKVRNEEIRETTTLQILSLTIEERRLRCLGHVLRMDDNRLPKQAIYWEANNRKWRPGRPRKNWLDIIIRTTRPEGNRPVLGGSTIKKSAPWTEKIGVNVWLNVS